MAFRSHVICDVCPKGQAPTESKAPKDGGLPPLWAELQTMKEGGGRQRSHICPACLLRIMECLGTRKSELVRGIKPPST